MITNVAFLWVVRGNQQRPAGVAEAQALAFNLVFAGSHGGQEQIDDAVIQKVQFVHIQHSPVGLGQKARLKHWAARAERGGHVHGTHEAILRDAERNLNERRRNHP